MHVRVSEYCTFFASEIDVCPAMLRLISSQPKDECAAAVSTLSVFHVIVIYGAMTSARRGLETLRQAAP